ncbi:MAG: radical SAM protein [Enhygromyxa sp.]
MSILDVTGRCNLRCVYCCRGELNKPGNEPELDELVGHALQVARARGTFLVLQGGEPLLRRDFAELLRRLAAEIPTRPGHLRQAIAELLERRLAGDELRRAWMRALIDGGLPLICLTTNGMRWTEALDDAVYAAGVYVEVSIDSPRAELNEQTRPGFRMPRVLQNIRGFARRNPVELSCTATSANVDELAAMLPFAAELGCAAVKINPVQAIGLEAAAAQTWRRRYVAGVHSILDLHGHDPTGRLLKIKLDGELLTSSEGQRLAARIEDTPGVLFERKSACMAYKTLANVYIDPKGNVYGCSSFNGQTDWIMGNLNDQGLREIWQSERRTGLRARAQALSTGGDAPPIDAAELVHAPDDAPRCPASICAQSQALTSIRSSK